MDIKLVIALSVIAVILILIVGGIYVTYGR